ncbi:MAG TPA: host attachment protein [Patescibacteria group bacterium]|nr:host attachment protein [Patescibacteria group bacterium]
MIFESTPLRPDPIPERPNWILIAGDCTARVFYRRGEALVFVKEVFSRKSTSEDIRPVTNPVVTGGDGRRYRIVNSKANARRDAAVFCKELAAYLERAAQQEFDRLVLVAGPEVLIWLKASISPQVQERLLADIAIDMTSFSGRELEKQVAAVLPREDQG